MPMHSKTQMSGKVVEERWSFVLPIISVLRRNILSTVFRGILHRVRALKTEVFQLIRSSPLGRRVMVVVSWSWCYGLGVMVVVLWSSSHVESADLGIGKWLILWGELDMLESCSGTGSNASASKRQVKGGFESSERLGQA